MSVHGFTQTFEDLTAYNQQKVILDAQNRLYTETSTIIVSNSEVMP